MRCGGGSFNDRNGVGRSACAVHGNCGCGWVHGGDTDAPQAVGGVFSSGEDDAALVHDKDGLAKEDDIVAALCEGAIGYQGSGRQVGEDAYSAGCGRQAGQVEDLLVGIFF